MSSKKEKEDEETVRDGRVKVAGNEPKPERRRSALYKNKAA